MKISTYFSILAISFLCVSCSHNDKDPTKSEALNGTDTAVVGIYLDSNGYPQPTDKEIKVRPGQKIVFAGPDKFDIFFKDQKSPIPETDLQSTNGIIIIEIPKEIFEKEQRTSKSTTTINEIIYRYGIRANGKVTDPNVNVCRC